jgi:hypothetical protein
MNHPAAKGCPKIVTQKSDCLIENESTAEKIVKSFE